MSRQGLRQGGWELAASVLTRVSARRGQAGAQGGAAWTCTVTVSQSPPVSDSSSGVWGRWWDLGKGLRVGFGTQEISVMLMKVVKTAAFRKWLRISGKLLKVVET